MDLYLIGKQHIDNAMREQFEADPKASENAEAITPRASVVTTLRLRLSADLRALAAAIEPGTLTPEPRTSHR
jgi:hypothetical protein